MALLYGPTPVFATARELQDLSDEADVADDLVQGETAYIHRSPHRDIADTVRVFVGNVRPRLAPRDLAERAIVECHLADLLKPLVKLPVQPDDAPLPLESKTAHLRCDYCNEPQERLNRHYRQHRGTCQLENRSHIQPYLLMLNEAVKATGACEADVSFEAVARTSGYNELEQQGMEDGEADQTIRVEEEEEEEEGIDGDDLPPSSVPPSLLYWTSEEKERLFQALPRFSRFRPDAIADAVKTKSATEVAAYLDFLEEQTALLSDGDFAQPQDMPAAREMSAQWLAREESLAADCVVWEEFVTQARRTPLHYRDAAQRLVTADDHIGCESCASGECDGTWPICGECSRLERDCQWTEAFHPDALPAGCDG